MPAMMERREQQRREAQTGAAGSGRQRVRNRPSARPSRWSWRACSAPSSGSCRSRRLLRAAYSERQLEEVLVDFWFNHFNVFAGKGQVRGLPDRVRARRDPPARARASSATARRDARRARRCSSISTTGRARRPRRAHGRATPRRTRRRRRADPRDPRRRGRAQPRAPATRLAPRTLADRPRSAADSAARGLNENYARELMELHTLGVDGGYTQKDVRSRARVHRLDDRQPAAGRRLPLRAAACTTTARRSCWGTGSRPAAARRTASRCSTSWRSIRRPRGSSRPSWRGGSSPTSRRRRSSIARPRQVPRRPTATSARSCGRSSPRRSSSRRRLPRQGQDAVRVRRQRRARDRRRRRRTRCRSCSRCASWACRSTAASRRPATPTPPRRGSTPARCSNRMNFAVALTGRSAARALAGRVRHIEPPLRRTTRQVAVHDCPRGRVSASPRPRPWRKASSAAQAVALMLGSPEFQKR